MFSHLRSGEEGFYITTWVVSKENTGASANKKSYPLAKAALDYKSLPSPQLLPSQDMKPNLLRTEHFLPWIPNFSEHQPHGGLAMNADSWSPPRPPQKFCFRGYEVRSQGYGHPQVCGAEGPLVHAL